MLEEWGANPTRLPPVSDDPNLLSDAISQALHDYDIVLVNAGSSAGTEDYTASCVEELGDLVIHGVAIRPGHPIVLGVVQNKPVMGIPGYPVSAVIACELFVKPIVESRLGRASDPDPVATATMTRRVPSPPWARTSSCASVSDRSETGLSPPPSSAARGVISSLVRADGIARVPRNSEGIEAGSQISVRLLRPMPRHPPNHRRHRQPRPDTRSSRQPSQRAPRQPNPSRPPTSAVSAAFSPSAGARPTSPVPTSWTKTPASTTSHTSGAISQADRSRSYTLPPEPRAS